MIVKAMIAIAICACWNHLDTLATTMLIGFAVGFAHQGLAHYVPPFVQTLVVLTISLAIYASAYGWSQVYKIICGRELPPYIWPWLVAAAGAHAMHEFALSLDITFSGSAAIIWATALMGLVTGSLAYIWLSARQAGASFSRFINKA